MDESALGLLAIFGFFAFIALAVYAEFKIGDILSNRKEAKHRKEHPEFFRLRDEFGEKVETKSNYYNKEISPRKCKVDSMLREEAYWPQEVRGQKMEEVEKLRREIYTAECTYKELDKDTQEARQKVVEYVRTHNIKWAGVWE